MNELLLGSIGLSAFWVHYNILVGFVSVSEDFKAFLFGLAIVILTGSIALKKKRKRRPLLF